MRPSILHFCPGQQLCVAHNTGHPSLLSMLTGLADTNAIKAEATTMTEGRCIVCEDVIWGQFDLNETVSRRLFILCAECYCSWSGWRRKNISIWSPLSNVQLVTRSGPWIRASLSVSVKVDACFTTHFIPQFLTVHILQCTHMNFFGRAKCF